MGQDRCWIIGYSRLSNTTHTDLSSFGSLFVYCSYTWAVQIIRGIFHLDIALVCWVRVIRVLFSFLWSPHSWRSWQSRRQGARRYLDSWCTDTLGGLFEHVPDINLFQWCSFSLGKSKTSGLEITLLKCSIIRISNLSDARLQEFYCNQQQRQQQK